MNYQWINFSKGFLILLVVVGHVAGAGRCLAMDSSESVCGFVYRCIYAFHMPAFFIIAGLCWRPYDAKPYFCTKIKRLLMPYFIFGICSSAIYAVVYGYPFWYHPFISLIHAGKWPNGEGFRCNSVLWFLPCMFLILSVYWIIDKMLKSKLGMLILMVGCFILNVQILYFRVIYLPWGLDLVPLYMIFFLCGRILHNILPICQCKNMGIALLLILMIPLIFYARETLMSGFSFRGLNTLLAISYTFLLFYAMQMLPSCFFSWLEALGKSSLGIMLTHKFFVVFLQEKVLCVRNLFKGEWCTVIFGLVFISIVSVFVSYWVTILIRKFCPWCIGENI